MLFSSWLKERVINEAKGGSKPVQMPKERTNIVKLSEPSPQRRQSGRRDTAFKSKKEKGTRASKNKEAMDQYRG
jgi:hypothetical protein